MPFSLTRRLAAEAIGTFFLVMAVVGSGIMAQSLADGDQALVLLCNAFATGAILFVIIVMFVSLSGAHFNPAGPSRLSTARAKNRSGLIDPEMKFSVKVGESRAPQLPKPPTSC